MHLYFKNLFFIFSLILILALNGSAQTTYECTEDDRTSGTLRAVGRVQIYFTDSTGTNNIENAEIGTAFILPNGKLVTAGHLAQLFTSESYVQFGTLHSDAYGHPLEGNPNDKYKIISPLDTSKYEAGLNDSDMNDWAVFEVQPNSNTGKMPRDVYGYIEVERVTPSTNMDIYFEGYGFDSEQTKSFSRQRSSGKVVSYISADYAINFDNYNIGGHSGGPIINIATGKAIGIVTKTFCNIADMHYNSGISFLKDELWKAMGYADVTVDYSNYNGTIDVWNPNASGTPSFVSYPANTTLTLDIGSTPAFRAVQAIVNGSKFNYWSNESSVDNHLAVTIDKNLTLTANLYAIENTISIGNRYISKNTDNVGSISFKDPWLIDYADPAYGNNMRNRGMEAPFKQRTSPFSPDDTTSYNGDVYQGVFLNQNTTFDPSKPYYSVRAGQTQTTTEHGESVTWHFDRWDGTDVQYQYPDQAETPVVFNAAGATATAYYKGHLVSNKTTATGPNYSRVLARSRKAYAHSGGSHGTTHRLHMAYADGGEIWYSNADEDNIIWSNEQRVSDGNGSNVYPSVATLNDVAHITWAQKTGNTWHIRYRTYDHAANSWSAVTTVASFSSSVTPTPVIALTENPLRVMIMSTRGNNITGWLLRNGSWQGAGLTISGDQPSLAASLPFQEDPNTDYPYEDIVLAYRYNDNIYLRNWNRNSESWSSAKKMSVVDIMTLGNQTPSVSYRDGVARVSWRAFNDDIGSNNIYERTWQPATNVVSQQMTVIESADDSYNPSVAYDNTETIVYTHLGDVYKATRSGGGGWTRRNLGSGRYPALSTHNPETIVFNRYGSVPYFVKTDYEAASSGGGGFAFKTNNGRADSTAYLSESWRFIYTMGDVPLIVDMEEASVNGQSLNWDDENHSIELTDIAGADLKFRFNSRLKEELPSGHEDDALFNLVWMSGKNRRVLKTFRLSDLGPLSVAGSARRELHVLAGRMRGAGYLTLEFPGIEPVQYTMVRPVESGASLAKGRTEAAVSFVPRRFALQQNYPNPFNPLTHIVFDLPQGASVRLAVYDLTGRKVADLVNGYKEAGRYNVAFDASHLASGMYVYRIEAGKYSAVRRMLLMK